MLQNSLFHTVLSSRKMLNFSIFNEASKNTACFNRLISVIASLHKTHIGSFQLNVIAISSVEQLFPLEQACVYVYSLHSEPCYTNL